MKLVWNNANRKNLKYLEKDLSKVTLSTKNPTWTSLELNLGLCGKRLESNQLSNGISAMDISINLVSQYCNELPVITLPSLIGQNVAVQNIESKKFSPLLQ